jgi:hypothetical protein
MSKKKKKPKKPVYRSAECMPLRDWKPIDKKSAVAASGSWKRR